jgi:hypothetical protein
MFDDGADGGQHPVLAAPAAVRQAAEALLRCSGLSLRREDVQQGLVDLAAAQAALEAAYLHWVRLSLDAEPPSERPGAATRSFLTRSLRIGSGPARADVEAARATDPDRGVLRGLGAALADGEVTRAHVDVAVRAVAKLPAAVVRERREDVEGLLLDHARSFSPPDAGLLARHLLATVAPEPADCLDPEPFSRRAWTSSVDATGMVVASGQLDPAGGALYTAVLRQLAAPGRARGCQHEPHGERQDGDGGGAPAQVAQLPVVDDRTTAQRYADAQVEMARLAAAALGAGTRAGEPPRVVVHCTPDQLRDTADTVAPSAPSGGAFPSRATAPGAAQCEQTGALAPAALQRLACDAAIDRVVLHPRTGAVLEMRSLGRLATPALRRALAARDGGCTWPGCTAPPSWCDAHHVVWWTHGGPTAIDNLALLCQAHHTAVHTGEWAVEVREGVPWFIPPPWVDPERRPLRNSLHSAIAATRRAGQALTRGEPLPLELPSPIAGRPPRPTHPRRPPDAPESRAA